MAKKNNLSRDVVRLLRKVQKFLIAEPRRFDMSEGITGSNGRPTVLQQPPCGTACCIAGAGFAIAKGLQLKMSHISFGSIDGFFREEMHLTEDQRSRLFYIAGVNYGTTKGWPELYGNMYKEAKTPLQRACAGLARIEHFIATDGAE